MATPDASIHDQPAPTAVITGASLGLGAATARALAGRGWNLVIDGRRETALASVARDLGEITTVIDIAGDVADPRHRTAVVDAAAGLGNVRLLLNNASTLGASPLPRLDAVDQETFVRTLTVNLVAPIALAAELLPYLEAGSTIVNISSDAAVGAYEGWGVYGSSKAALDHAGRILAVEHPELRVLSVDPGDMRTQMHQDAFPGEDISDRPEPEASVPGLLALIEGDQPSGRYEARPVTGAVTS